MTPIQQAYKLYKADKAAEALAFLAHQRPRRAPKLAETTFSERKHAPRTPRANVAEAVVAPVAKPAFGPVEKALFTAILTLGMGFTVAVMIAVGA